MSDLKQGTPVRVTLTGRMVARPRRGAARVSMDVVRNGKTVKFWAVVPEEFVEEIE